MRWDPRLIWLHVISDALIVLAYAAIPCLLLSVVRKRKDVPFSWMLLAFASFILACGATHVMSIVAIWRPVYVAEGVIKVLTAVASISTAICLYRLLPFLLKLPSLHQLKRVNEDLERSHEELEQQAAQLEESYAALEISHEAHRKSEIQFRELADSMPHIVWTADGKGKTDYFNERWYSFTGFDRSLTTEQSWAPLLHPDDSQRVYKNWDWSISTGSPYREEYRLWDRVSSNYRWHIGRAVPSRDASGSIVKWFGACIDVDDYKRAATAILSLNTQLESKVAERTQDLTRANDELRRTQTWLQAILHSALEVSIVALDEHGIITYFNAGTERLLGYKAQDVVGKCTPYLFYPADQCEQLARELSIQMGQHVNVDEIFLMIDHPHDSFVAETAYVHQNGTRIDVNMAISPMIDANGERLGKLAIAVDTRPQKALERQLTENNHQLQKQTARAEEANRAKSEFLSAMSHEIRTPMNAILGMADLLWETELGDTQRRYVEVFRRACTNLLSLVNDILDLSKIESGRFELEQIDFDLQDVIQLALEMIQPKIQAKQLALKFSIAANTPCWLAGDPTRLQQILTNLLSNAVKFTESGAISLSVEPSAFEPTRLYFEVTDTGIGIPEDKLESIFQDFEQAESSTTRRFGGTGLGLGICRRLVNRMGGELSVRSKPGTGSTFYFDALFGLATKEERSRKDLTTGLSGRRVLIVDDNHTNRMIFTETCRSWGMETAECLDVADVLTVLNEADQRQQSIDLLIIDRLMNGEDGLQLAAKVRQANLQIPILMITSDSVPGDQTKVQNFGVTEYAVKPVRRNELLRLICKLLGPGACTNETIQAAAGAVNETGPVRILIAEDSDDNRFLLEEYLKAEPYEVTFVENGEQALEAAKAERFSLILMDMQMPVMDGLTATRKIREAEDQAGRPRVALLALTANARRQDIEMSRGAGCDGHVSKPISKQELLNTINQYARNGSRSREIHVQPGFEAAAQRYLLTRKQEVPRMLQLVESKEFEQLRILAHNMKGTGTSYGFPDLTELGGIMERSAREQDAERLTEQIARLAKYVQQVERAPLMAGSEKS